MDPSKNSLESSLEEPATADLGAYPTASYSATTPQQAAQDLAQGKGGFSPFHLSKPALILSCIVIGVVAVIGVAGFIFTSKEAKSGVNNQQASNYSGGNLAVKANTDTAQISQAEQLAVNGQLQVNNGVVVKPSSPPEKPVAGQIYYDKTTNQLYYYNGKDFVSTTSPGSKLVTSLGGQTGAIAVGNGLQVAGGQISLTAAALQALASAQAANNIKSVSSGDANIAVSNDGRGNVTITQTAAAGAIGGTGNSGSIALFTGAKTLAASILSQSGSLLSVAGDLQVSGLALANTFQQTAAGNNVNVSAGNDRLIFTAGGRTYEFPVGGPASQTICTSGVSCASGAGVAVALQPGSAQTDNGTGSSIFINNTGGGNLVQLQSNGVDRFVVDSSGNVTTGTIPYGQVTGRPATTVTSVGGASGALALGTGLGISGSTLINNGVTSLTGTANQVIVSSSSGNVTVSLPQDLAATSAVNFASLGLSSNLAVTGTGTFGGNVSVTGAGTLSVSGGATTLGGSLSVTAATTLGSTLGVTGNTAIGGTLGVTGASTFTGLGSFNGGVAIGNNTNFSQTGSGTFSTGTGNVTLNGNTSVTGARSFTTGTGTVTLGSLGAGLVQSNASGVLSSGAADRNSATLFANALGVPGGGTGASSFTLNSLVYGNGAGALQATNALANAALVTGAGGIPTLSQTLPVAVQGNITSTGALASGSIASGFGIISTGNNITTTAAVQGASVTASGALQGNTLSVAAGAFAVNSSGAITATTGITTSGGYTQSGAGVNTFSGAATFASNLAQTGASAFSTGTGAVSLNGNTSVTGTNTFSVGTGATSLGGILGVTGAATIGGNATIQGGNITVGVAGSVAGSISFANGTNASLSRIQASAPSSAGTATFNLPSIPGASSDQICVFTLANCDTAGNTVTASGGVANYLPVFDAAKHVTSSIVYQTGTSIGINTATPGAFALNVQSGNVNFSGSATVGNGLSVTTGASSFAGNVGITGTSSLTVGTGATNLGGSLGVTGAANLSSTLSVGGTSTFNGNVSVGGANTFSVGTGTATLGGALNVAGIAAFTNSISQTGTGTFSTGTGNVTLNGATSISGTNTLTVGTGATALGGTLGVAGLTTLSGGTTINGATSVTGTATINTTGTASTSIGNATGTFALVSSAFNVTAAGALSGITSISASGAITAATSGNTINGLIINGGSLSGVAGIATSGAYTQTGVGANTFSGASTFTAAGTALTVNNNATITGTATVGALAVGAGGITDAGTLTVNGAGASTIAGQLNLTAAGTGLAVTNNATVGGSLTVTGSNGITVGVPGPAGIDGKITFANATTSRLSTLQAGAPTSAGTANYTLPGIGGGTSDTICLQTLANCSGGATTVNTSSTGTNNTIVKFTSANTVANSSITDDGTTVGVGVDVLLSGTNLTSASALNIVPGGNLAIGATNRMLSLQGNGTSSFSVTSSGITNKLAFVTPTVSNKTISVPDEAGTLCIQGSANCGFATAGSGVTSFNTRTGAIVLNNASSGSNTITINNAVADGATKGIATFNSTNFSAALGVINTIQNINNTANVQFGGLTLGAGGNVTLSSTGTVFSNNYYNTGAGNDITFDSGANVIIFRTQSGATSFKFPTTGGTNQTICTDGITCATGGGQALILEPSGVQTAGTNRTAIFVNKNAGSGNIMELQSSGVDALVVTNTGTTQVATLNTDTIKAQGALLTIGESTKQIKVQGDSTSLFVATDAGFNTNVGFGRKAGNGAPIANVNYQFQNDSSVTAGTYFVCTTVGNCSAPTGSVTSNTGGTAGFLPKFTSGTNIENSIIGDNGSGLITIGGNLTVGVSGSSTLTLGVGSTAAGSLVFKNATNNNALTIGQTAAPAGAIAINFPNQSGTVAVAASGPITLDATTGQISCATCLTSGGGGGGGGGAVQSITGSTGGSVAASGAITLNNALTTGSAITIDNASTAVKGIASFNATNFTASSGAINTVQDIATTSSPSFSNLSLTGATGLTLGNASNVGQLIFRDGSSAFKTIFSSATITGGDKSITVPNASGTLAVSASGNLALSALGALSITNTPSFTSVTNSGGTLTLGSASQTTSILGGASTSIVAGTGANTTTLNFTAPSGASVISFPVENGTVCLRSSANCGFALAGSTVTSLDGRSGALTLSNSTGSGTVVTIDDATTAVKGIASFNSTNFTASAGAINTVQNINTAATPSFAGLSVAASGLTVSGTAAFSGNTSVSGSSTLTVGTGATALGGTLGVTGLASLSGGLTVTGATSITGAATINTSGTANTSIGNATGTFALTSAGGLNVSAAGALTGVSTLTASGALTAATSSNTLNGLIVNAGALSGITGYNQSSGNFVQSGAGTFATGSGTVTLNGNTSISGSNTLTVGTGATALGGLLTVASTINGQTISNAANFTGSATIQGAGGLTLGVASTTDGKVVFASAANAFVTTLKGTNTLTADQTVTIPKSSAATDNVCLLTLGNCVGQSGGAAGTGTVNRIAKFTAANTLGDSSINDNGTFVGINTAVNNGQVSITTSGTQSALYALGATTGSNVVAAIRDGGSGGDLLQLQNSGGTPVAKFTSAGALTAVGVNSGTGLIQGTGGLTVSGAAASINASSNFATNINTGNSTGAVSIGNSLAGAISLQSASSINVTAGAASTITTGANSLTVTSSNFNVTAGGNVSALGTLVVSGTAASSVAGQLNLTGAGTGLAVTNAATIGGTLGVTGLITASGGVTLPANQNLTLTSGTGTISQTFANTSGTATTVAATNSASSGASTVNGVAINLTGTANGTGSNTNTALNLGNVAAQTNNSFYGVNIGTGYTDLLRYSGTQLISGLGKVQDAAIDPALTYTNLQKVGALTAGSIGAGFGTISTGNNISTSAALQGNTVTSTTTLTAGGAAFTVNATGAITASTGVTTSGKFSTTSTATDSINTTGGYTQTGSTLNLFTGATSFTATGTALTVTNTASVGTLTGGTGGISTTGVLTVTGTAASSIAGQLSVTGAGGLNVTNTATVGTLSAGVGGISTSGTIGTSSTATNSIQTSGGYTQSGSVANVFTGATSFSAAGGLSVTNAATVGSLSAGVGGVTTTGTLTVSGATATFGAAAVQASLVLNAGNTKTATLQALSTIGQNTVYTLPDAGGATATICLNTGNCAGSGAGVTTTGGTANYLARFTGTQSLGNSLVYDSGTAVSIGGSSPAALFNVGASNQFQVSSNGAVTLSGVGGNNTIVQTFSTSSNATGITQNVTNSNSTASATAVSAQTIGLTGTASGNNVINGINFTGVSAIAGNNFYGLNFGTGFTDLLRYNSTQLISGTGKVQNAAVDSTINYSNLQSVTNLTATGALGANSLSVGASTPFTVSSTGAAAIANSLTITSNSAPSLLVQTGASASLLAVNGSTSTITIGNGGNTVTFGSASGFEPILAGNAQHTQSVTLTAEYPGAVLDAAGDSGGANCATNNTGTMISGLALGTGLSGTNPNSNYYDWTSTSATSQCYDVAIQIPVPGDFASWNGAPTVQVWADSTANTVLAVDVKDTAGTQDAGGAYNATPTPTAANTWQVKTLNSMTGTYTPNGNFTVRIRMTAKSSAHVRIGNVTMSYKSKF